MFRFLLILLCFHFGRMKVNSVSDAKEKYLTFDEHIYALVTFRLQFNYCFRGFATLRLHLFDALHQHAQLFAFAVDAKC